MDIQEKKCLTVSGFIPNEILVLEQNFILVSCHWKRTSFRLKNRKSFNLGRAAHVYLIWRENHASQNALGWAGLSYHVSALRTSLWNDTHSGLKIIPVSCEIMGPGSLHEYEYYGGQKWFCYLNLSVTLILQAKKLLAVINKWKFCFAKLAKSADYASSAFFPENKWNIMHVMTDYAKTYARTIY